MQAEFTRYAVPGWGVGELWTENGPVLSHGFAFRAVSDTGPTTESDSSSAHGRERVAPPPTSRPEAGSRCGTIDFPLSPVPLDTNRCLTPQELVERLTAFLAGADVELDDVPLDLDWTTPFQRAVADVLRSVPRGEVVSYGELAALAGYPGAARAVGTFCAENRFMFFLPCHRVVGAGGIGGYGSAGVRSKRRLLGLEGVRL